MFVDKGTHGFMRTHKWRHSIGAFINVEAFGTGGLDLVCQSGPGSWPSSVYAQSAIYPMAYSAAQTTKGFSRVEESLDDLALDVPDARKQFLAYVEKAKTIGWLDSSFHYGNSINGKENGACQ
ncbi:uncharacterized protein [Gossypium hirsutum]|uniref:MI domain-containing protein n=1 Tax=Gossypium hirsutum TaxID=3635 RepID=A0ABM3A6U9_GOSHI|nr:uncharacterized protein LOC121217942 [Gossypium hirsutum]